MNINELNNDNNWMGSTYNLLNKNNLLINNQLFETYKKEKTTIYRNNKSIKLFLQALII